MPRVGILTYHSAHNYGAVLQAWALSQVLRQLGASAHVIDYQPRGIDAKYARRGVRRFIPSLGRLRMRHFVHTRLPLSERLHSVAEVSAHALSAGYDRLICGSDQVWFIDRFLGFDRAYFLDLGDKVRARRVAYAPSCGKLSSFGPHADAVGRAFARFHALSARDENTLRLVSSLATREVEHVVDPTLLADYELLLPRPRRRRKEQLVVVGPTNAAASKLIAEIAQRLKLEVTCYGARCAAADRQRPFASPEEWAGAIAGARFVATSLFHGAAFAIRFRRPFVALDSGGRGFKLADLLGRFGLRDRYLVPGEDGSYHIQPELLEPGYGAADGLVTGAVERSRAYLRKAIYG